MELMEKIRGKWQKYLKDMAEANEKTWKGKKPSCCDSGGREKGEEKEGKKEDERR